MVLPRFTSAIVVLALIGVLTLVGMVGVTYVAPAVIHGANVMHADGFIAQIPGPDKNFVLKTAQGKMLSFECGKQCRASLGHLQRHLREHAHTDVYYTQGPNNTLLAVDVD